MKMLGYSTAPNLNSKQSVGQRLDVFQFFHHRAPSLATSSLRSLTTSCLWTQMEMTSCETTLSGSPRCKICHALLARVGRVMDNLGAAMNFDRGVFPPASGDRILARSSCRKDCVWEPERAVQLRCLPLYTRVLHPHTAPTVSPIRFSQTSKYMARPVLYLGE